MDTILRFLLLGFLWLWPATAQSDPFCIVPPHDALCRTFPEDQSDFSRFFEYRIVNAAAQKPFDTYAWQAFVALNWPGDAGWRGFARKRDVMGQRNNICGDIPRNAILAELQQSDGNTLIDQAGNFIVYEIRLNPVAEGYILENALQNAIGRSGFGAKIDFPKGRGAEAPASVLIKTAWRILPAPDIRYIQAEGHIPIPASRSTDGQARCLQAKLGLVGMHIVSKVASGNGDKWIWATVEHRDTVPTATNARAINSLFAKELFPQGCQAPKAAPHILFSDCLDCPTNAPPDLTYWAARAPYARDLQGHPAKPSQIVRCWKIFGPTQDTNALWQAKLGDSVLANYQVISAQWRGANPDPIFPNGELPRYLSNTTMESYVQTDPNGTCLGCHTGATTPEGAPSDFTFLFR